MAFNGCFAMPFTPFIGHLCHLGLVIIISSDLQRRLNALEVKVACNGTIGASLALPLHLSIRVLLHPHTHNRNGLLLLNFLSSCPVGSTALPSVIIIVDVCFMDGKISEPLWWMVRGQVSTGWDYMWKFRKINPTPEDGEKNLLADVGGCALCTCRVTQMGRPLHSSHIVGRSVGGSSGPVNSELTK